MKIRRYIVLFLLLIFIIYTIILITVVQNRNIGIIAKQEDTSKAMPESTEITELQKQIENLQKENEDLLTEISKATATDDKILSGEKVWTNGNIEEGTIESKAAQTYTPETTDQTISAGQYLSGAQTIKGDANLVAENIKKDVSIFGVTGTAGDEGAKIYYLGTGTSFDVKSKLPNDYDKLTANNFIVGASSKPSASGT